MKITTFLLLAGLLSPTFVRQQEDRQEKPPKPKSGGAVTRFFAEEGERLEKELEGSWMLLDYTDPNIPPLDGGASGFATFHAGFLTWMLAIDSAERGLFGPRAFLVLESAAYRYHVDEQANLQLASVMSFTNNTEDGELEREPSGIAFEYFTRLDEGVLELRDPQGVVLSFRKVEAGDFPDSARRKIDRQRGGTQSFEEDEER